MLALLLFAAGAAPPGVAWHTFDEAAFARAKAERKLVILDLGTGWCHWCHVMDEESYGDPGVQAALAEGFVSTRADADERLDLAQRYEDYGWPATIVLDADGRELVKLKGFLRPARMLSMLQAVREDPTPGPSIVEEGVIAGGRARLTDDVRARLAAVQSEVYESAHGGWGRTHKYVHAHSMDLALDRVARGDVAARAQVIQTLEANARWLLDPVEGGVFQYSDRSKGDRPWSSPHYEKIMAFQASNLRHYAVASSALGRADFAAHARDLARYLTTVLASPDGAFYASQDADVGPGVPGERYYRLARAKDRAKLGAPRIDRSRYARETAQAALALAEASGHLGDEAMLARAVRAMSWVMEARRRADGTYRHGDDDARYLGDTLAAGQAALALYHATAERRWLAEAMSACDAIGRDLAVASGGFASAPVPHGAVGALALPVVNNDENVDLARFANLLAHATGRASDRAVAEHAMKYLTAPANTAKKRFPSGILLADAELGRAPVHVTIVGRKDDPAARALFARARAYPASYARIEWLDRREGALPGSEVELPDLPVAAAFACAGGACSSPVKEPSKLFEAIARVAKL